MILLTERSESNSPRIFVVFGVGLVGSAVIHRLQTLYDLTSESLTLDWQNPDAQALQLSSLEAKLHSLIDRHPSSRTAGATPRLIVLWSAGSAGFQVTEAEAGRELSSFRRVLRLLERVTERQPPITLTVGLTSSAGGLFEGQRAVDGTSSPSPRRPYGEMKLAQETALSEVGTRWACRVYRLSSAYGFVGGSGRRGLIPTLVMNGLRHDVTRITGSFSTLRDYVWVEDVAAHVAADLAVADASSWKVRLLASTKPSSIFEILRLTERVMARPLYVNLTGEPSNRADITFARSSVPSGWLTTPLETTIRRIYRHALHSGAGYAGAAHW
jgi:UDP-glucose 4-epimerase